MSVFLGTFVNKVDRKGRVSVPAAFRAVLGERAMVAFPPQDTTAIDVMSMDRVARLSAAIEDPDQYSDEEAEEARLFLSEGLPLQCDSEGRVVLPTELAGAVGIDAEAAFVGLGEIFQIWHPGAFEAYKSEKLKSAKAKGLNPRRRPRLGSGGRA